MATTSDGDMSMSNLIRKYRKKLRQIEHLERLNRALSEDEAVKVESKYHIRDLLLDLLSQFEEENENEQAIQNEEKAVEVEKRTFQPPNDSHCSPDQAHHGHDRNVESCDKAREDDEISKSTTLHKQETIAQTHVKTESKSTDQGKKLSRPVVQSQEKVPAAGDHVKREEKKKKTPRKSLPSSQLKVTYLEGHNDLIRAVVIHNNMVISASQDTTVKTWDILTGMELKNFGGHTDSVTCLAFLDVPDAQKAVPDLVEGDEAIIVSGSFDCSLKVWSLNLGHLLKSIYTYNPITKIAYASDSCLMVVGTDTGKLELWNLGTGEQCYSLHAYDASVTGIKVCDGQLYTCASDGAIKIYSMDKLQLSCKFESENVKSVTGGLLTTRHVRSLEFCKSGILIGDDARNIKILNWRKNEASKVPNHHSNYSSADAICCHGEFLVSSSYDLDTGLGYFNVRCSSTLEYLGSLDDKETERILCVDFTNQSNGDLVIISGGVDLKMWQVPKQPLSGDKSEDIFETQFRQALTGAAIDSEDEEDYNAEDDDIDYDDDEDDSLYSRSASRKRAGLQQQESQAGSWMSWCSVL